MHSKRKTVHLDAYEEGAVIEGLNKLRTEQLDGKRPSDFVSDLMLKIIRTPTRKGKIGSLREPSAAGRVGEGGATEQASFCCNGGETSKRSPRRRNESR